MSDAEADLDDWGPWSEAGAPADPWDSPGTVPHAIAQTMLAVLGGGGSPIDPCANTYDFVKKHRLTLEGRRYDLDDAYRHLQDLYQDTHRMQVAMAGAQTGKSGWLLAMLGRLMCGPAFGQMIGFYFPDIHLPLAFSRDRFKPFLRSNPELGEHLGARRQLRGGKGIDNALTMTWSETTLYWLTIAGKTATEGLPLKAVLFDEVRRMDEGDIERAQERYSAQTDPYDYKVSTARYPEQDIHKFFLRGDQRFFHSGCACPEGTVLSLEFPDCIADLRRATPQLIRKVQHAYSHAGLPYLGMTDEDRAQYPAAAFICPKCGEFVVEPRDGWWEPHAPESWVHSWQMPQCLSPTYSAGRILLAYETAESMMEFYNSKMGLPHLDPDKMPVHQDHLDACVDRELRWAEHWTSDDRKRRLPNTAMGVDVQAGYLCAVIKGRGRSGKHRTLHVEVVTGDGDPWLRLARLMQRYQVALAIVDHAPEFTAAMAFAQAFRSRVYLQQYTLGDTTEKMVAWDEEALGQDRKQRGEIQFPYWVAMNRTKALHWGCMRWVERGNEMPDPRLLIQDLPQQNGEVVLTAHLRRGLKVPTAIGMDPYQDHLKRWIFRKDIEDTDAKHAAKRERLGKVKQVAEYIGKDPHFSHADTWASIALTRLGTRAEIRL